MKFSKNSIKFIHNKEHVALFVIGIMILSYTIVLSVASIKRWTSFNCTIDDLGIMIQTIYNTSQGRFFEESVNLGIPLSRFWLAHWEFIYLPLALFYKLIPRSETLLVLQSLFLAMGALPVYLLSKNRLQSRGAGIVLAVVYLLYPAMHNANLFDVHGVVFSTSLLLYAFYFLDKNRINWFLFFAFLALLCREDIAIIIGMTGFFVAFKKKNIKLGALLCVVGAVWFGMFYVGRGWLINYVNPVDPELLPSITKSSHWAYIKGGRLILEEPIYFLDEYFFTVLNAKYLIWLLAPVGFLSLVSPWTLIIAAPILMINLTSSWLPTHLIEYQYTAAITPIIFVSAIFGFENILQKLRMQIIDIRTFNFIPLIILTMVLLSAMTASFAKSNLRNFNQWKRTSHHETIDRVASLIPEDASLSVDMILGTHTAERQELYAFPDNYDKVDFILYDFGNYKFRLMSRSLFLLPSAGPLNQYIQSILHNRNYGVMHFEDGVVLFKRGYNYDIGLRNLLLAQEDEIENPVKLLVNESLVFSGFTQNQSISIRDTTHYHFTLYWSVLKPVTQATQGIFLLSSGVASYESSHKPAFGLYPKSHWLPGEIIREEVYWQDRPQYETGKVKVSMQFNDDKQSIRLFKFFR